MPHVYVKVYMFQMFCALSHIHSLGVCHRDIKPQNLLVDTGTHTLKLCDFGSAKILVRGERNISYICSRYYRCARRARARCREHGPLLARLLSAASLTPRLSPRSPPPLAARRS